MIVLSAAHVHKLLKMDKAIDLLEHVMIDVSEGKCNLPLRFLVNVGDANNLGIMPGVLEDGGVYGVKLLSLFPQNPAKGLSSHLGAMVIFDPETGMPAALVNADALTAIRTAAASAAATRALSSKDATNLTIIGTGEQAQTHIKALTRVRDISQIFLCGRTLASAVKLASQLENDYPAISFHPSDNVEECTQSAHIICTLTSSKEIVLRGEQVSAGTHVNAVGASIPSMQEIDVDLVTKSKLFVDYKPSALAQAKDIIDAIATGNIDASHIKGEIGEVYSNKINGRQTQSDITLYRSLGVAAQDLACAEFVRQQAEKLQVGVTAEF